MSDHRDDSPKREVDAAKSGAVPAARNAKPKEQSNDQEPFNGKRLWWYRGIGLAMILGAFLLRGDLYPKWGSSTALFLWLPVLLAVGFVFVNPAKTYQGTMFLFITFALLLSGIVIPEGIICIVMAAPFFYGIGGLIVWLGSVVFGRSPDESRFTKIKAYALLPAILVMSLEGFSDQLSFHRDEVVSVTRTINSTPKQISKRMAETPRFDQTLPLVLRAGFPRPVSATGRGLALGGERTVTWSDGGYTKMVITETSSHGVSVRFTDQVGKISNWLKWESSSVEWRQISPTQSRVTWTLRYRRLLDPAWYFGPWERYVVTASAGVLIDNLAAGRVD